MKETLNSKLYILVVIGIVSAFGSKQISGKNALTLIHENAIEHIIPELRHSTKVLRKFLCGF